MDIRIKYHNEDMERLVRIEGKKSDWIDLRVAKETHIKEGDFQLVDLGVSIELPVGYEAHVCPRSSMFKNFGLIQTNSIGIIDHSYCGDNDVWKLPVYCLKGKDIYVDDGGNVHSETVLHVNDRICQFRIVEQQPQIDFVEVDTLGNDDRGGLGSTGVR